MSSQGISTLLEAEKEASKIVQKARQYRTQRLKDARIEALKEIEELKAKKTIEFQELEKQLGNDEAAVKEADAETLLVLQSIQVFPPNQEMYKKNKDSVIEEMLKTVGECQPVPHKNVLPPKA